MTCTVLAPALPRVAAPRGRRGRWLLGPLVVVAALGLGAVTAVSPVLGFAATGGLALVAVAARDLPLALVLWIPTLFLEALPAFNAAGKAGGLVVLGAWALEQRRDPAPALATLRGSRRLVGLLLLLMTWSTVTVLWAPDWRHSLAELVRWYAVGVLFVIVATVVRDAATLRRLVAAFAFGGVLAVVVAMTVGGGVSGPGPARLGGAAGDPNFLGAWLLSSGLLVLGLLAVTARVAERAAWTVALCLLAAGMAFTLSRGAFVSTILTSVVALALLRGRRRYVLGLLLAGAAATTAWLSRAPEAWDRLSEGGTGSGRSDLWTVAWEMARDNPALGVGLKSFTVDAAQYMREVGPIPSSYLISRAEPDEVHNVYLQVLAEGGPLALLLLLLFAATCLRASWTGARLLDAAGQRALASLAYAVLLAQCSLLSAAMFLSSVVDKRLWLLLALGPVLAGLGRAQARPT